jgi:uncharacterized protein
MSQEIFERSVTIGRSAEEVFAWHERPGAFQRLLPPWEKVQVLAQRGGIRSGARVTVRSGIGPFSVEWEVEHRDYEPGRLFRDVQLRGPFAAFEHEHRFEARGAEQCVLRDVIRYRLPGGKLGLVGAGAVRRRLERLFRYRHAITQADLELPPARPGRVLISGASGLLGGALQAYLSAQGWDVWQLVRREAAGPTEVAWAPEAGRLEWPEGVRFDAIVHLAGVNVASGRWTAKRQQAIRDSRRDGTRTLVAAVARHQPDLPVLVSASAVGFYGDRGEERLDDSTTRGGGFLADVCEEWEAELAPLRNAGTRVVALRTGVVLTPAGGALKKLDPVFKAGLGGRVGSGQQWMSWISIDDWLDVCRRALTDPRLNGAVNAVAPTPVRNVEFVQTLAAVLRRPALLPVPRFGLRTVLGQMADETLLASTRAVPDRLAEIGHRFRHEGLEAALRHVLGRSEG